MSFDAECVTICTRTADCSNTFNVTTWRVPCLKGQEYSVYSSRRLIRVVRLGKTGQVCSCHS